MKTLILLICALSAFSMSAVAKTTQEEEEFHHKLVDMLQRSEKSEKILRQQIIESQTAPFLPDLYLQLAQLLSDKSNTLYYIQMEKSKGVELKGNEKELSPVIQAQKEAIGVYRLILKDFATFGKRREILYRLALALKSIDELMEFMRTAIQVTKEYPNSEEAMGCRLLLGQYYLDKNETRDALQMLLPIAGSTYVYERNLAKYRIGLVYIAQEKWRDALKEFEGVILDPELKEQDNPYDVTIKKQRSKSDLKREALIDSIRAYTHVYENGADPVPYYSKLAPTEVHFQEVIEKLALRYIGLKKYDSAIKLLRTLSERTIEPQKIVNIYHDVLLMIPISGRLNIPVEEMRFLLEKYNLWTAYYSLPEPVSDESYLFLEKQVRELGTTAHSFAKSERRPEARDSYYRRARDYYQLYLAFFRKTKKSVKIATDLADVYFATQDFEKSGDFYLRIFLGEFGPSANGRQLVENAILCLQKKGKYTFYENVRMRGLLIKSIESYVAFDPKKRSDPDLAFLMVKTQYEQGFFPETLDELLAYAKRFPKHRHAEDAGELILDYFNTRTDYAGLSLWSGKLLALHLPDRPFNAKLAAVEKQAKAKYVQQTVRSAAGYDDFNQGKSYLSVALSSQDAALKNMALQEALNKSKRERDIQTFLQAAFLMAQKETDGEKRAEIFKSVANENIKVTRYYHALPVLQKIYADESLPKKSRIDALEEAANLALILHDWRVLRPLLHHPLWTGISAQVRNQASEQIADLLEAPVPAPGDLVEEMLNGEPSPEVLLSLYKAQYKVPTEVQETIEAHVKPYCKTHDVPNVCLWDRYPQMQSDREAFERTLSTSAPQLSSIQTLAPVLMKLTEGFQPYDNSGDPQLALAASLEEATLYRNFGRFLEKAASANPDMRAILEQKAKETTANAKTYLQRCQKIAESTPYAATGLAHCASGKPMQARQVLAMDVQKVKDESQEDPTSDRTDELQKSIFASQNVGESMLSIAREYLGENHFRHATAAASYGISLFKERAGDFQAVLGCSTLGLGLLNEARFHLKNASNYGGLQQKCLKQLGERTRSLI